MSDELAIFALGTVLFPGGVLPLRVFEARYVDMIRRAMRDDGTFGVCLISAGNEVGKGEVQVERIGCRARIDDWNMERLGVLEIVAIGTERFEIVTSRVERDGLLVAKVEPCAVEAPVAADGDTEICAQVLGRILVHLDSETKADDQPLIAKPYLLDDATWVGNRLSELMPLPMPDRQKLMALTNARERLDRLQQLLAQHGVVGSGPGADA